MNTALLIDSAMQLDPVERFKLIEALLYGLDQPNPALDQLWGEEAERRLAAYRCGKIEGIPAADVVGEL